MNAVKLNKLNAPHTPGRPNGADNRPGRRFHFTPCAVVVRVSLPRSVELRLLNCQGWIPVGSVTIPMCEAMPEIGWVVAIRYLGASRECKALNQPSYLGRRKDIEVQECILSQLRFKADAREE